MNNNEIMNNEVVEATEEVIENAGLSKGVKIAAGIGLSVVVGVVVYKYVAKPVIANIKAGDRKHQSPDRAEKDGC